MAIITISREFGSDSTPISQNATQALGYLSVDKKLIGDVLQQYGMITFKNLLEEPHGIWERFDKSSTQVIEMLNKTILTFAKLDNCIILGRGGFVVLEGYDNVVNVLIRAPFDKRVDNTMKAEEITDRSVAEALVEQNDEIREDFLRVFYSVDGNEADWYNIVIDSSVVPVEAASNCIIAAANATEEKSIDAAYSTLSDDVDVVLARTVDNVIKGTVF